jgi:mutator protein MutT
MKKQLTLCMVCRGEEVLLGLKKRGFGEGLWNGFGGKVEEGETLEEAAVRELKEEVGLSTTLLDKMGVLEFSFESEPKVLEVHIYRVDDFAGEPLESEEMLPQWFAHEDVPYDQMWPDDKYWLPYLLAGKMFEGKFHFDRPSTPDYMAKILKHDLREVGA